MGSGKKINVILPSPRGTNNTKTLCNTSSVSISNRWAISKEILGEGSSATVYRGFDSNSGQMVAIKQVNKSLLLPSEMNQVQQEIVFLQTYRHPNIIKLFDVVENNNYIYIILEYAECDLYSYVSKVGKLAEDQCRVIFSQICKAISFLHSNRIAHRDLKLENFVVNSQGIIKIIDFGLSSRVTAHTMLKDSCGSMAYSPPEIVSQRPYLGTAADIWSLGVVLYTILLGGFPFYANDVSAMKDKIVKGKLRFPKSLSDKAKSLIVSMLSRDPMCRPEIYDVMDHLWMLEEEQQEEEEEDDEDEDDVVFKMDIDL